MYSPHKTTFKSLYYAATTEELILLKLNVKCSVSVFFLQKWDRTSFRNTNRSKLREISLTWKNMFEKWNKQRSKRFAQSLVWGRVEGLRVCNSRTPESINVLRKFVSVAKLAAHDSELMTAVLPDATLPLCRSVSWPVFDSWCCNRIREQKYIYSSTLHLWGIQGLILLHSCS